MTMFSSIIVVLMTTTLVCVKTDAFTITSNNYNNNYNNQYRVQNNDIIVRSMGFDLSGNTWKPDSASMGSTDTGDYFPDDFDLQDHQSKFQDGMMGSQQFLNRRGDSGPALPGLENLGSDAIVRGGIAQASEIPMGMQFIPSSVPDGVEEFQVASQSSGSSIQLIVKPVCMTFEDYYAAFAPGSHPSLTVGPVTGRMDRRGGDATILTVACTPNGQAGQFIGNLVINLPEDNSKICYKIIANCY